MSIRMCATTTPGDPASYEIWRCGMVVYRTINKNKTLCHRLLKLKGTDYDLISTMDAWARWRKNVRRIEVHHAVNLFRKAKMFKQALQLHDWMDDNYIKIFDADHAIRIQLLFKLKGIEEAENHFKTLRKRLRTKKTYGALLSCYLDGNMIDKALSLIGKMREFNALKTSLNYNIVMGFYMKIGQPEMVPVLFKELEAKNIRADIYTYNHLMTSYASMKDLKSLKGVLERMRTYGVAPDWFTYGNLAAIYAKAGVFDEARLALDEIHRMKKLEELEAFQILMKTHTLLSDKEGIYRSWESIKTHGLKPDTVCYLVLIVALSKVGDFEGLVKYFKEWESCCSYYDIRLPNVIMRSYLDRDMFDEASTILERVKERGTRPNLKTLYLFMNYHLRKHEIQLAFGYLEMGLSKSKRRRNYMFLDEKSVSMYLNYFEEAKSVDDAEKFYEFMKSVNRVDVKIYESLLRTYVAAGKEGPEICRRMMDDNVEISTEARMLLEKVGSKCVND